MNPTRPDFTQALGAGGQPAKRARSPQGRGRASCDEEKQKRRIDSDVPASTVEQQQLRRCRVMADYLEASTRRLQAQAQQLLASGRESRAAFEAEMSGYKQLRDEQTFRDRMSRYYRLLLHGDAAALRLQALQEGGRRRALAHVGISSSTIAPDGWPWGDWITILVQDWPGTWQTVLTDQHKKELIERFGCSFIGFLGVTAKMADMAYIRYYGGSAVVDAKARETPYTLNFGMPWAERYFIMEAIDNLEPEAVREGAQSAYLEFFGSGSWEEEWKRMRTGCATCSMPTASRHCYTYA